MIAKLCFGVSLGSILSSRMCICVTDRVVPLPPLFCFFLLTYSGKCQFPLHIINLSTTASPTYEYLLHIFAPSFALCKIPVSVVSFVKTYFVDILNLNPNHLTLTQTCFSLHNSSLSSATWHSVYPAILFYRFKITVFTLASFLSIL